MTLKLIQGLLVLVAALTVAACSMPGPIASSTMPVTGKYVELGGIEESTSCGITVLIPISNPKPLAEVVDNMIKDKGGDALIEVSSGSSASPFSRCITVRGKVVKFTR